MNDIDSTGRKTWNAANDSLRARLRDNAFKLFNKAADQFKGEQFASQMVKKGVCK